MEIIDLLYELRFMNENSSVFGKKTERNEGRLRCKVKRAICQRVTYVKSSKSNNNNKKKKEVRIIYYPWIVHGIYTVVL